MTSAANSSAPRLRISDNKRFLVKDDGTPFFYLGDTAWELFHRLNREEVDLYLQNRADKHFSVIQAVVLAELDGLNDPNPYGHTPLQDNDPAQPNEGYFEHVDYVVNKAASLGLFIAMLPTWSDKVASLNERDKPNSIFTEKNAAAFGEFLGRRYKDSPIIWVLGGDRAADSDEKIAIWRAMAAGLSQGDGGTHLRTWHPPGGGTSAEVLHNEEWLDFNMQQNGHDIDVPVWERITRDYNLQPTKPVFDGEPLYEDHPIAFNAAQRGHSNAADIRKFAYWSLFSGGHGFTYGNHAIWQMYAPGKTPINRPLGFWFELLDQPGASQMRHVRALMESRPFLARVPDFSLLASDPGAGGKYIIATRDAAGSYAFIYIPASRRFSVRLDKLSGDKVVAWWFNPRTGEANSIGEFDKTAEPVEFTPPDVGENLDWVLVLDDAAARYTAPGSASLV